MSLPTPPRSSHRRDKDKENKFFEAVALSRSVTWVDEPEIHSLSTPLKTLTVLSRQRPSAKHSILKKSSQNTSLEVPTDTKQRHCTPEPTEILRNEGYLTRPLTQIISVRDPDSSESLAALIEGYNVLAARLRSATAESTDGDCDWPLFRPLRQNTEAFVGAIVRDLGRALVGPLSSSPAAEEEKSKFILPSPEKSPTRKKDGMTGEQVKYARDLCTTCHSVIRMLAVIFVQPGFYKLFDEKQLRRILAAVLAIPLEDELPTPNARKTCALAIWLIQVQRLPAVVLQPAADRIAYALRRGIDGELGKEGKKGSASDGLKAICDLCEYLPEVFVSAFVPVVPSVLSNLLANTLTLRTQACHALSGLVLGLTSLPRSSTHTKVSSMVASFLTTPGTPIKADSPNKKSPDAAIVRTLKATMSQTEPQQPAQGPVWALGVLAGFIVLLNSRLCTNVQANQTLCNLVALGLRHKKSSIRALTCLVWRCLSWSYLQPPLPTDSEEEFEVDDENEEQARTKRAQYKIMMSVLDCQTGVANIAALLGDRASKTSEEVLRVCLELLNLMAAKSGHSCYDATQTMVQMVGSVNGEQDESDPWDHSLLLPKALFSASNGLFTTEYKNLTQVIRPLFENLASIGDVRPLTCEELTRDWVLAGLMTAWKSALGHLELGDEADMPPELITTWGSLLKVNVNYLKDGEDTSAISRMGVTFIKYLTDILEDPDLNLTPNGDLKGVGPANRNGAIPDSDGEPAITGSSKCTNSELRLRVVRRMWNVMKSAFPKLLLVEAAEGLLACLMRNAKLLLTESAYSALYEEGEQERDSWATLCIEVSSIYGPEAMRVFWGCEEGASVEKVPGTWAWDWTEEFTNSVWKTAVEKWRDDEGDWEGASILLGVPFTDKHAWNLTSEDFNIWEEFLGYATDNALDHGIDSSTVLDNISFFVSSFQTPGVQPYLSIRLADLLLCHLDISEMRAVPQNMVEWICETMRANYPPETKNKAVMRWLARSLTTLVDKCPSEFCLQILQALEDGVALWLADKGRVWEEDEFNYDMIPLYQHILITIQSLPDPVNILCAVSDVVGSVFSHRTPSLAVDAFVEFWRASCANVTVPAGGWPENISRTLRTVNLLPNDSIPHLVLSPAIEPIASPRTPFVPSYSTPQATILKSPRRPRKGFGKLPAMPTSPESPTVPRKRRMSTSASTPRTPLSNIQNCDESPSKRRRFNGDDKENLGIHVRPLASVAERIAEILKPNGTLLRKRKLETREDAEDTMDSPANNSMSTPSKRMKDRMKPKRTKSVSTTEIILPSLTLGSESDERKHFEKPLTAFAESSLPNDGGHRKHWPIKDKSHTEDNVRGTIQIKKIDLSEIRKSRLAIKRTSSTPAAMWDAIEGLKRKLSSSDEASVENHVYRKRYHVVRARRTASMPERRGCFDSDSTVVELPLTSRIKCKSAALHEDMASLDDTLPGSDDTVASSGSSSEEDSPTKDAVSRHLQRIGLESRTFRPVL